LTTDPTELALDFDEIRDVTVIGAAPRLQPAYSTNTGVPGVVAGQP
jgi:hypothetical protein